MSKESNKFMGYFDASVDYPRDYAFNPLPVGTLYCYISSSFLNAFVNNVTIVKAFVLGKSLDWNEELRDPDSAYVNVKQDHVWTRINVRTKHDIFNAITQEGAIFHSKLDNDFKDDVLVLGKAFDSDKTIYQWVFFWYDRDCSDCCIGKFETDAAVKDEDVVEAFGNFCNSPDRGQYGSREIPLHYFRGWLQG